jgi:two-component system, LytTR family, response regulator
MIKTLIVDDELLARAIVKKFLEIHTDFELVGEAADGFEALKMIKTHKPDLLILDIQMPKITGLEMVQLLENPIHILFCTAYDQYAVQAFEARAVDYLLKPFDQIRFDTALEKVKEKMRIPLQQTKEDTKWLAENQITDRIVVKNGSKIEIIPIDSIVMVEAYGDYIWIHTADQKFLKQQTLKSIESLLGRHFVRVHRSTLVSVDKIKKVELYEKNTYQVLLKNGLKIGISKAGHKELKERLGW